VAFLSLYEMLLYDVYERNNRLGRDYKKGSKGTGRLSFGVGARPK